MVAIIGKHMRQLLFFRKTIERSRAEVVPFTFRHYLTGGSIFYVPVPF